MKKKNVDGQKAADLLQKLQAAVLSSQKKKQERPDQDEIDFQNKIAAMLQKATGSTSSEKKSRKASPKRSAPEPEISLAEPQEPEEETVAKNPTPAKETAAVPASIQALTAEDAPAPKKNSRKKSVKKRTEKKKLPDALQKLTDEIPAREAPATEAVDLADLPTEKSAAAEPTVEEKDAPRMEEHLPFSAETEETDAIEEIASLEEPAQVPEKTVSPKEPATTEQTVKPAPQAPIKKPAKKETAASRPQEKKTEKDELPKAVTKPLPPATEHLSQPTPAVPKQIAKPSLPQHDKQPSKIPMQQPTEALVKTPPQTAVPRADAPIRIPAPKPPEQPKQPPMEQLRPQPMPERIVIAPKPLPTSPISEQKDIMQDKTTNTTAKQEDSIVIKASAPAQPTEPIVIRPRRGNRSPEPTVTEQQAPQEQTPITVKAPAASADSAEQPPKAAPAPKAAAKTAPKRKNPSAGVTLPPSSAPSHPAPSSSESTRQAEKKPAPKKPVQASILEKKPTEKKPVERKPAISMPRRPHRKPSHINRTPIATLPEDEHLNEALDEIMPGEEVIEVLPMEEPEVASVATAKKGTLFSRRRNAKAEQQEPMQGAISLIEKKTGMTEDDIAMIFDLGYENELGRLVGYETLKKLKYEHIRKRRRVDDSQYRTALGYRNAEYTGKQPREGILSAYAYDKKRLLWQLVLTALIALVLVPLELPSLFEVLLAPYRSAFPLLLPVVFPIAGMLLLILAAVLSRRQLLAGARSLFRFSPTPYSLNAVLIPLSLLCGLLSFLIPNVIYVPANLGAVCSLLLCSVCDVLRISDELRVFRILSADGPKTVLEPAEPRKKKLRLGDKIVKIINDDVDQNLYRVRQSEQVSGFFRRCNDFSSAARPFMILICTMLSLSLAGGLFGAVYTDSLSGAISAFVTVLVLSSPLSALLLYFYPLYRANRLLAYRNCALAGEESAEEYSVPKTVIFHDSDMYVAQKCTQISVRDGEDFRQDMRLAGILFRKMSGTLGSVGESAPLKNATDPPVAFVRLTENGTEAVVDGHHLLAGNAAFMAKSGVRVPKESSDRTLRRAANASLMYVAINGTLKLSYEIEYTGSKRFEETVSLLAETDTLTAIQTYDPNLNEAFLENGRGKSAAYVRVIKPGRYEQDGVQEVSDSGAVALGNTTDIARPILAATAIRDIRSIGFRWLFVASILGAVGAIPLILLQESLTLQIPLFASLLWHTFCLAVTLLLSRHSLRQACELPERISDEQH